MTCRHFIKYLVILKGEPGSRWNSSENKLSLSSPNTKKNRKGATNRQWRFLMFLNLLEYGDNEIQIAESMSRKTSTKSLEPDASVYCLTYAPPPHGKTAPNGPGPLHHRGISTTLRHTTLSRSPLDKRSARSRDLYLTTHNAYKRQTSMPPAGFKPATPARQRPHTDTLDHAATGVGTLGFIINQ